MPVYSILVPAIGNEGYLFQSWYRTVTQGYRWDPIAFAVDAAKTPTHTTIVVPGYLHTYIIYRHIFDFTPINNPSWWVFVRVRVCWNCGSESRSTFCVVCTIYGR